MIITIITIFTIIYISIIFSVTIFAITIFTIFIITITIITIIFYTKLDSEPRLNTTNDTDLFADESTAQVSLLSCRIFNKS